MRDALTAFAVCDNDFASLDTRVDRQGRDSIYRPSRAANVSNKVTVPTSPASENVSFQEQFTDAQSVAAFDEIDRRRTDATEVESWLSALRENTYIQNATRIADRIANLLELYQEDYDGRTLSSSSLNTFLEFLKIYPESKFPSITATPSGELYVQWRHGEAERLGVQFMAGGEVKWALFKRNQFQDEQLDQFSGKAFIRSFRDSALALGIQEWIVE
ncbi:hypothetical protein [Pseudomonas chlororaphis]|uniref:hypothetical protein n=2 Tax=Pseudomonas chlororaphis TaxID=587753 RepID=UPI0014730D2D|nr:hypothetical protein [Pseudomonas chlororaphis]NNB44557.1 hypothetical protein [Pseudomonas chlororaphis]